RRARLGRPRTRVPRAARPGLDEKPGKTAGNWSTENVVDFHFQLDHDERVMKTARASLMIAALVVAFASVALPAHAATYFTVASVMKSFFPSSKKVSFKRITLTPAEAAEISKRVGVESIKKEWVVYIGETDGKRDGFAIVDEEKGMHDPIDFAVRF